MAGKSCKGALYLLLPLGADPLAVGPDHVLHAEPAQELRRLWGAHGRGDGSEQETNPQGQNPTAQSRGQTHRDKPIAQGQGQIHRDKNPTAQNQGQTHRDKPDSPEPLTNPQGQTKQVQTQKGQTQQPRTHKPKRVKLERDKFNREKKTTAQNH